MINCEKTDTDDYLLTLLSFGCYFFNRRIIEVLETAAIYKAAVFDYNDKKGNTIDGE